MIIAQITDTHIKAGAKLAYRKVDTAQGLTECVAHLNALSPAPDVVVMSGDLTDFGKLEEYRIARPILDSLAMPYYIIPGNHDEREAFRQAFADHAYLPRSGYLNFAIEDLSVRLIGLDTVVDGQPYGELCQERLDWLDAVLAQQRDRVTLIFMHHPPFVTGIRHMDWQNCRNAKALGEIVVRNTQVQMILCGHVHRPIERAFFGTIASIGPSPCHAVSLDLSANTRPAFTLEPAACRLVYLTEDNRLVAHLSFIGDFDGPHPFFNSDGTLID